MNLSGSRIRIGAAAAVLALAVGLGLRSRSSESGAPVSSASTLPATSALEFADGSVVTYAIKWQNDASIVTAIMASGGAREAPLTSRSAIEGELRLVAHRDAGGATVLTASMPRVERAVAETFGKPLGTSDALASEVKAAEASLLLDGDGTLRELGFSKETSVVARGLMRALLLEVTATLAASKGANVVETAIGRARIHHVTTDGLHRRIRYDELDAYAGASELVPSVSATSRVGVLGEDFTSAEKVDVDDGPGPVASFHSETTLDGKLVSRERTAPVPPPSFTPAPLRTSAPDAGYDRKASLERRSVGVTRDSVVADVSFAGSLPKAAITQWVWRDSAWLELHPEQAKPLLARFEKADITTRAALFDVLVVSGTVEAQEALVSALEAVPRSDEEAFVVLVPRMGYLREPTRTTAAWLARTYAERAGTASGHATGCALGAVARAIAPLDEGASDDIVSRLEQDLRAAKTPAARALMLRAVGNAGLDRSTPAVLKHANDPDEEVRASVASALRKPEGGEVVDALLVLFADRSAQVSRAAIGSLFRKQLEERDWARVTSAIALGKVPAEAYPTLVNAASLRGDEGDPVLKALLTRSDLDPKTRVRIDSILGD